MKKVIKYCGLGAMLAGAAFCLPNCDDDGTGPQPYDGPWKIVPCPEGLGPGALDAVFFLKPDLGYAVGCGAFIIKYDGTTWNIDYKYPKRENEGRVLTTYGLTGLTTDGSSGIGVMGKNKKV